MGLHCSLLWVRLGTGSPVRAGRGGRRLQHVVWQEICCERPNQKLEITDGRCDCVSLTRLLKLLCHGLIQAALLR